VDLTCTLTREERRLVVQYRIDNHRHEEIAVLDQLPTRDIDGAPEYLPESVFVSLESETVHLIKGSVLLRNVFPYVYDYPDARLVAAGASVSETFAVPLPVEVKVRYKHAGKGEQANRRKAVAREVALSIGVVPTGAGCRFAREKPEYPEVVSVYGNVFEPGGGLQLTCQTMISARFALDEDLPVLDYQGFPWDR
jgi:hypothetical protein